MLLRDLYPDFTKLTEEEQTNFIRAYRLRRSEDLKIITTFRIKKVSKGLSPEEKELLKALGLRAVDIRNLQDLNLSEQNTDDEEEEVDGIPRFTDADD